METSQSLDVSRRIEEETHHHKGHVATRQMRILKELSERNRVDRGFEEYATGKGWGVGAGEEEEKEEEGVGEIDGKRVAVARLRAKNKNLKEIIIRLGGKRGRSRRRWRRRGPRGGDSRRSLGASRVRWERRLKV